LHPHRHQRRNNHKLPDGGGNSEWILEKIQKSSASKSPLESDSQTAWTAEFS